MLAAGLIGIAADGLDADHRDNLVPRGLGGLGVNQRTHVAGLEIGRLFIHERDQTQRAVGLIFGHATRQRQKRRDAAAVVVGAGGPEDRIVVGADEDDFIRFAFDLGDEIGAGLIGDFIF